MSARSAGRLVADELRATFRIGTRTRRYGTIFGHRADLHHAMIEAIETAAWYPGYYDERRTEIYARAYGTAMSYRKHVQGHRIDGVLAMRIHALSAYRFAALLGEMVDADVTTTGDGERFFARMARDIRSEE